METEQTEPHYESLGAFLGFHYGKDGPDFVKALLDAYVEDGDTQREQLELAACELKALKVNTLASLVVETAKRCPSMTDIDAFCPYLVAPYINDARANQANITSWQRGEERRANKIREQCKEILRKAGVDPDWINGETRQ